MSRIGDYLDVAQIARESFLSRRRLLPKAIERGFNPKQLKLFEVCDLVAALVEAKTIGVWRPILEKGDQFQAAIYEFVKRLKTPSALEIAQGKCAPVKNWLANNSTEPRVLFLLTKDGDLPTATVAYSRIEAELEPAQLAELTKSIHATIRQRANADRRTPRPVLLRVALTDAPEAEIAFNNLWQRQIQPDELSQLAKSRRCQIVEAVSKAEATPKEIIFELALKGNLSAYLRIENSLDPQQETFLMAFLSPVLRLAVLGKELAEALSAAAALTDLEVRVCAYLQILTKVETAGRAFLVALGPRALGEIFPEIGMEAFSAAAPILFAAQKTFAGKEIVLDTFVHMLFFAKAEESSCYALLRHPTALKIAGLLIEGHKETLGQGVLERLVLAEILQRVFSSRSLEEIRQTYSLIKLRGQQIGDSVGARLFAAVEDTGWLSERWEEGFSPGTSFLNLNDLRAIAQKQLPPEMIGASKRAVLSSLEPFLSFFINDEAGGGMFLEKDPSVHRAYGFLCEQLFLASLPVDGSCQSLDNRLNAYMNIFERWEALPLRILLEGRVLDVVAPGFPIDGFRAEVFSFLLAEDNREFRETFFGCYDSQRFFVQQKIMLEGLVKILEKYAAADFPDERARLLVKGLADRLKNYCAERFPSAQASRAVEWLLEKLARPDFSQQVCPFLYDKRDEYVLHKIQSFAAEVWSKSHSPELRGLGQAIERACAVILPRHEPQHGCSYHSASKGEIVYALRESLAQGVDCDVALRVLDERVLEHDRNIAREVAPEIVMRSRMTYRSSEYNALTDAICGKLANAFDEKPRHELLCLSRLTSPVFREELDRAFFEFYQSRARSFFASFPFAAHRLTPFERLGEDDLEHRVHGYYVILSAMANLTEEDRRLIFSPEAISLVLPKIDAKELQRCYLARKEEIMSALFLFVPIQDVPAKWKEKLPSVINVLCLLLMDCQDAVAREAAIIIGKNLSPMLPQQTREKLIKMN